MQANFDESQQSQLSAVELKKQRREDNSKFILKDVAFESLKRINDFEHKGKKYPFSDKNVWDAIEELEGGTTQRIQVSIAMRTWAGLSPQEAICEEESWIMRLKYYQNGRRLSK